MFAADLATSLSCERLLLKPTKHRSYSIMSHWLNMVFLLSFCGEEQDHKIDISMTLFWWISTRTGTFFCRNQKGTIVWISPELVSVNVHPSYIFCLFIYLFFIFMSDFCIRDFCIRRRISDHYGSFISYKNN